MDKGAEAQNMTNDDYLDPTYGGRFLTEDLDAGTLPESELPAQTVRQIIFDDLQLDGNPVLNMASFVTTWMEDEALEILTESINKNFVDEDEYPQTARIHQRVMKMMAQLFNAPDKDKAFGVATVGSSEAIMLGLLAHKWAWRERRKAQGLPYDRPNIVFGRDVHTCWEKFTKYFDVEWRPVNLHPDRYVIDVDEAMAQVDENTIAVGCVLGTTFTGQSDPIQEVNARLVKLKQENPQLDIPLHVDAASGGFVYPFVAPDYEWDFRLEQVQSINTSNHKFGLVYPGMGTIMFRDKSCVPKELVYEIDYLGEEMSPNYSLNFSRPSAYVISQYYNFLRFGRKGYSLIMNNVMKNAQYLEEQLMEMGKFELLTDTKHLPVVVIRLRDESRYDVFAISHLLRERGWIVPAYKLPPNAETVKVLRMVVKENFGRDLAVRLVKDIKQIVEKLEQIDGLADHASKEYVRKHPNC